MLLNSSMCRKEKSNNVPSLPWLSAFISLSASLLIHIPLAFVLIQNQSLSHVLSFYFQQQQVLFGICGTLYAIILSVLFSRHPDRINRILLLTTLWLFWLVIVTSKLSWESLFFGIMHIGSLHVSAACLLASAIRSKMMSSPLSKQLLEVMCFCMTVAFFYCVMYWTKFIVTGIYISSMILLTAALSIAIPMITFEIELMLQEDPEIEC